MSSFMKKVNLPVSWIYAISGSTITNFSENEKYRFEKWKQENRDLIFNKHSSQFYGWCPLLGRSEWQAQCSFS